MDEHAARHAEEVRPRKQGLEGRDARISQILPEPSKARHESSLLHLPQSSGAVHFYGIGHFLLRLCSGTNRRYAAFGGIDPVHCAVLPLLFYRLLPEIYLGEDADRCG